jgi:ACS family hexuronate transporter-like MFS transporter
VERAFAIGLFNAGSNIGAILAPLTVPAITLAYGWRIAFIVTGLFTVIWLIAWLWYYRSPCEHKRLTEEGHAYIEAGHVEEQASAPWASLLRLPETWAYIAGRFLIDPIWWTFLFWLPDFFSKR